MSFIICLVKLLSCTTKCLLATTVQLCYRFISRRFSLVVCLSYTSFGLISCAVCTFTAWTPGEEERREGGGGGGVSECIESLVDLMLHTVHVQKC